MLKYAPKNVVHVYSGKDGIGNTALRLVKPTPTMPDVSAIRSKTAPVNMGRMAEWAQATRPDAIRSFKKGGIVHKTGLAMLHKGEVVVPKHKVDKWLMSDTGVMGARYSKSTDNENASS